jgi:hypothetical protein
VISTDELIAVVADVQRVPYRWPSEPTAQSVYATGAGSCASKHALLAAELAALGVLSRPLLCIGPLVPSLLADHPVIADGANLVEVHELLTVDLPSFGPVLVDVTWDPPLIRAGLPGTLDWDGASDMTSAVGSAQNWYAPDPVRLRNAKEALRRRMYSKEQRERRDRVLAAMSSAFEAFRRDTPKPQDIRNEET